MSNTAQLSQNEGMYKMLLAASPDPIAIYDVDGHATYINHAFEETFGWLADELVGERIDFVPEVNEKETAQAIEQVFGEAGRVQAMDTQRYTKNGRVLDVQLSASAFADDKGEPAGIIVILRDMTSYNKAEAARLHNEERYHLILENIEDGYYEVDMEGNFTFGNEALEKVFGWPTKELIGCNYTMVMDEKMGEIVYDAFHTVYITGAPNNGEDWQIIAKDGSIRYVNSSIALIKNPQGKPIGCRGIVRDITEQRYAQQALQASEERYRTIVESIQDGYYEIDLTGKHIFANTAVVNIFGYSLDELLGMSYREYTDKETAVKVEAVYQEVYVTGKPVHNYEYTVIKRDGERVTIHISISLITNDAGKKTGFRGLVRDVTARREAETTLQQAHDKLEDRVEERTLELLDLNASLTEEISERINAEAEILQSYEGEEILNTLLQLSMEDAPLDDLLERAFDAIISLPWFNALPKGSIFLVEDEADVLVLKTKHRLDAPLQALCNRIPFGTCLCGKAAATGEIVFAGCVDHDHELTFDGITEHGHYTVPILIDDEVAGVLNLYLEHGHKKTEREVTFLNAVAHTLSGLIRQKRADEALKSSEEKFRQLFEKSADAILLLGEGVFIDCNLATVTMMRAADKESFLSVHPSRLSPPTQPDGRDSGEKADEMIQTAFEKGTNQFEWIHRRIDGEDFPVEVTLTVVPWEGTQVLYTVWRDITERKKASDALLDSEANARIFQQKLQILQEVGLELSHADSLDELYLQAVVLGRERLGYDRLGLLLRDQQSGEFIGAVGTDEHGQTVDESHIRREPTDLMKQAIVGEKRAILVDDMDIVYEGSGVLGRGWRVMTGMWDGDKAIGWLSIDNLISQEPVSPYQMELLTLYGSSLGNLITRKRSAARLQASLDRRGQQMRLATMVAQEIVTASTLTKLYDDVVTLVKEAFGFYHVQLFLYDKGRGRVALVSSYGEVGKKLLAERHALRLGVGVVGTAVSTQKSILRPNVVADKTWRSNPYLPDTKGEMALLITLRGKILGVLDVQSDEVDALSADDELVVSGLCGQVATAIDSLNLARETEIRLEELNVLQREFSREGWKAQTEKYGSVGYRFDHTGLQAYTLVDPDGTAVLDDNIISTDDVETAVSITPITADLTIRGQSFGVFGIEEDPDQPLTDAERDLFYQISEQVSEALEAARLFEQTQDSLAEQERLTSELETVAEVSTAAATILEADRLLQVVVDLAKDSFNLYHAHVYLLDNGEQNLVLKAGSGTVGRLMVLEGREVRMNGHSLVAQVARQKTAIIENRVRDVTNFLPHPLLPDTKSEMAVPLIVADRLIGVMDLQSDQEEYFTDEDIQIQRTLSSQIAVSVQNARLYAEQVAAAKKLRQVDQLKSEFLASMSHELRTPLNSIIGFSDILLEGLDGDLTERMDEDIRLIRGSGIHLRDLIGEILDMSKIEAGRMDLRYEEIDVVQMVGDIVATAKPLSDEKSLYLDLHISPDVEYVEADRMRFRQIFYNIVSNAIKFTEKGGITIDVRMNDENFLLVSVQDTGIGIKPENIHVVFEQFRQIDGSLNRVAGGTGLGMPITRNLVELHGGEIWVESTYGFGSTFLFTMPCSRVRQKVDTGMLPTI